MYKQIRNIILTSIFYINAVSASGLMFTQEELTYIQNNEIKAGLLSDFYPFSFQENGKIEGISHDLLNFISQKSHLKIKYTTGNWSNNYVNFNNKQIDIIDSISSDQSREKYINFTKSYFEVPLFIISQKKLNDYDGTIESLKGKKLGITRHTYYTKILNDLNLFEIVAFDSAQTRFKALSNDEIDFTVTGLLNYEKIISDKNYSNLKILDEFKINDLRKEDLRFGIHKDNHVLFSIINKTFQSISEEELSKIKSKWLNNYSKKIYPMYESNLKLSPDEKTFLVKNNIIKMCNNPNYAPLEFMNEHNQIAGIAIDTIRLIEKKLDYKIIIQHVKTSSQEESKELFRKKVCDIMPLAISNKNETQHQFTKSYLDYKPVLITRDTEPFIRSLDDIKYKNIAQQNNPVIIKLLKEKYYGINILPTNSNQESFENVSSGKAYATLSILPVASYNITKYGLSNLKIAGHEQSNIQFSMAVNDSTKLLVPILNKSLNAISQKEKAEIFNKWANIKFDKNVNYAKFINFVFIAIVILLLLLYRQMVLSRTNEKLQKAKDKLEESNSHFVAILESTIESIFIANNKGIITECNQVACNLFGYSKEVLIGMPKNNLIDAEFHELVKLKRKEDYCEPYEINLLHKDGFKIPALVRGKNIIKDKEDYRVSIALDLTQLKKTQEALQNLNKELALKVIDEVQKNKSKDLKLLQQARHAQMGELISMIAHQWRQPLNAVAATVMNIQLQISLEQFDLTTKEGQRDFLNFLTFKLANIEDFIQTLSMTIDDFRNFYKPDNESKITLINVPIDKALGITKALILSKKIELELNLNSQKKIELFKRELLQVFLNLIKNSQDNFDDREIEHPTITINSIDTNSGVKVEVCDNGGGISPEIINNIFDPYFSTKNIKNGTGLGLYMSKTIIEEHHKGKLYVKNQGKGVCFTIELYDRVK